MKSASKELNSASYCSIIAHRFYRSLSLPSWDHMAPAGLIGDLRFSSTMDSPTASSICRNPTIAATTFRIGQYATRVVLLFIVSCKAYFFAVVLLHAVGHGGSGVPNGAEGISCPRARQARGAQNRPELSMGPFCVTQSNPTHQLTDPTQPKPLQVEKFGLKPCFKCINKILSKL